MSDDYSSEAKNAVQNDAEQAAIAREKTALNLRLKFDKIELIGDGGYGRVYKAFDPLSNQFLIAKCPKSVGDIRWPREVFYHKDLNGVPGVPKYLGTFEINNVSFLFVEYVEGQSLANRYADAKGSKRAPVDPTFSVKVIRDAAKIAHECHKRNLVHRDLSPNNLMIDQSDKVWVIDFGLSLKAGDWRFTGSKASGVGTYGFRSPEQQKYRSEGVELDARADVYSLGQVLCWLLSEQEKEYSALPIAIREDAKLNELVLPADIDKNLIAICEKAIAEWRDDRFPDAKSFADALNAWLIKQPVDDYIEPWWDRLNRCFRANNDDNGEAKILHVYHEIDKRPTVDYEYDKDVKEEDTVDESHKPQTDTGKKEFYRHFDINDPHAVINVGKPDWSSGTVPSRVAFFREIDWWRNNVAKTRAEKPRVLSANAMLFCEERRVVLVHKRDKKSSTFDKALHTFGGGFMPAFGKKPARDDRNDLLLTAIREGLEESRLSPSFAQDTPAIMCRELETNFHQLMLFSKPISQWDYERVCPQHAGEREHGNWEGKVIAIPFDFLEEVLIDPVPRYQCPWVPTGRLHILAWLAMGAPMLRPDIRRKDKELFGDKTPWEVYQSVTSAILQKQQELKADQ